MSASTARLITGGVASLDVLGPTSAPVEALAAVHYFAAPIEKTGNVRFIYQVSIMMSDKLTHKAV